MVATIAALVTKNGMLGSTTTARVATGARTSHARKVSIAVPAEASGWAVARGTT